MKSLFPLRIRAKAMRTRSYVLDAARVDVSGARPIVQLPGLANSMPIHDQSAEPGLERHEVFALIDKARHSIARLRVVPLDDAIDAAVVSQAKLHALLVRDRALTRQ